MVAGVIEPIPKPKKKQKRRNKPIPDGMTRAQMKGETDEAHAARVIKELTRGYRGAKSIAWQKVRDQYLAEHEIENGWYECDKSHGFGCGKWTQAPEVDHIIKRSVAPHLVLDPSNLQVLCHDCHARKDNGMKFK